MYALVDRSDDWHDRVRGWFEGRPDDVLLPVTVLPEICYLLQRRLGSQAELGFVRAVADGEFPIEPLEPEDVERAADLIGTYRDTPLGFVDATIVAQAERLELTSILTTDRRHFAVVRPRHIERLRLEP